MVISVAYGLLFGTFLTLLMLPALLVPVNRMKVNVFGLVYKQRPSAESVKPAVKEEQFLLNQKT